MYGLVTLVFTGFLILFLNSGIAPGSEALSESGEPLNDGLKTIFGEGTATSLLALIAVTGLVASFHTIIYAYGRNIFSLSRAGYYPHFLSLTHGRRNTPYVALLSGAVVGFGLTLLLDQAQKNEWIGGNLGAALLSMAVFGAVISYAMQTLSFILLRRRLPEIERPYVSPVGEWGAGIASIIAVISLVALFWNADYRPGVVATAIFYVIAVTYFGLVGRHRLVFSPEEEFAMTRGVHGHPEREGYGVTDRETFGPAAGEPTPPPTPPSPQEGS
jgi:ethanolamine permease